MNNPNLFELCLSKLDNHIVKWFNWTRGKMDKIVNNKHLFFLVRTVDINSEGSKVHN